MIRLTRLNPVSRLNIYHVSEKEKTVVTSCRVSFKPKALYSFILQTLAKSTDSRTVPGMSIINGFPWKCRSIKDRNIQSGFPLFTKQKVTSSAVPVDNTDGDEPEKNQHKPKKYRKKSEAQRQGSAEKRKTEDTIVIDGHLNIHMKSKKLNSVKTKPRLEYTIYHQKSNSLYNFKIREEAIIDAVMKDIEKMEGNESKPKLDTIDDLMWQEIKFDRSKLLQYYMQLSKIRLTALVVITETAGYFLAPGAFDLVVFLSATLGTTLASSCANSINQYLEIPYDSQMNRTKNRVLVRGILSPLHAVGFAAATGSAGITILAVGANPLTASLGLLNIGLYTMAYTPMKRMNMANTWVGSIVGAIPPLMGWTACTGVLDPASLLLGAIMYAWQFPHFNSLSWNLRQDYSRAGYRMMSVVNPALCKRVAFRYTLGMIGLCTMAPALGLTQWYFAVESLPLNAVFAYLGWRFYRDGDSKSSRNLFKFSLIHIPILFALMFLNKDFQKGTKDRIEKTDIVVHNG